jgi:pseudouridine synthase
MKKVRLQKYLAEKGIDSRRKCEELIAQGKVKVNNSVVTKLGTQIDPIKDLVEFEHRIISQDIKKIYILLNKPRGYLCTYRDPFGRPTIYDLLKNIKTKINYAGRLDFYSEGLVLLTNDGDFINHLTHPVKKIKKVYIVKIKGIPSVMDLDKLEQGIPLSKNFTTAPCKIKIVKKDNSSTILEVTLREGKKRQVRRMFSYIGLTVSRLKRIKIGVISLGSLKPGQYRYIKEREIMEFKKELTFKK